MNSVSDFILHLTVAIAVAIWKILPYIAVTITARSKKYARHLQEDIKRRCVKDFQYKQLSNQNAIRLLSIEPGTTLDPIKCYLEEATLDNNPTYNALSYSWKRNVPWKYFGFFILSVTIWVPLSLLSSALFKRDLPSDIFSFLSSSFTSEKLFWIICNGKRVQVHENLYDFLLQLRQSGVSMRFWIDALCINQNDIFERNMQVKLMPWIYKSAQHVIVWLGPCPSLLDSELIMGRVSSAVRLSHLEEMASGKSWFSKNLNVPNWRGPVVITRLFLKVLSRVHVLTRSYFERTWIIQEVLLSKKVTFWIGRHEMQPEQLIEVVDIFDAPSNIGSGASLFKGIFSFMSVPTGAVRRLLSERQRFQQDPNWKLADYIMVARGHHATENRDLVFAGLGLIAKPVMQSHSQTTDDLRTCVLLDYNSDCLSRPDYSAILADVFVDCTEKLLQESGLFALSLACDGRGETFPSWVPHFERKTEPFRIEIGHVFSAGGNIQAQVRIAKDRKLLHLESGAEHLDYVASTYRSLDEKTFLKILASLPAVYGPTGEKMISAIARSLIADCFADQVPAPPSVTADLITYVNRVQKAQRQQNQTIFQQNDVTRQIFNLVNTYSSEFRKSQDEEAKKKRLSELELEKALAAFNHAASVSTDSLSTQTNVLGRSGKLLNSNHDVADPQQLDDDENMTESPLDPGLCPAKADVSAKNTLIKVCKPGSNHSSAHENSSTDFSKVTLKPQNQSTLKIENGNPEKAESVTKTDDTIEEIYKKCGLVPGTSVEHALNEIIQMKAKQEKDLEEAKKILLKTANSIRQKFYSDMERLCGSISSIDEESKKLPLLETSAQLEIPKPEMNQQACIAAYKALSQKRQKLDDDIEILLRDLLEDKELKLKTLPQNINQPEETERRKLLHATSQSLNQQLQAIENIDAETGTHVETRDSELAEADIISAAKAVKNLRQEVTNSTNKISWLEAAKSPYFRLMIPSSTPFVKLFKQRCEDRCFFVSEKGYVGLGSSSLEKGDSIMVVPGAYVPFAMTASRDIARVKPFKEMESPREEAEKCREESTVVYRLKGELYVHGIMQGERTTSPDWNPKLVILE